jgi:hypothetical protein
MVWTDLVGWGVCGLVIGALAGATSGGGVVGFVEVGLAQALVWGAFGLFAGALYGLWAGRSASARRLKSSGPLVEPRSSMIVAGRWDSSLRLRSARTCWRGHDVGFSDSIPSRAVSRERLRSHVS